MRSSTSNLPRRFAIVSLKALHAASRSSSKMRDVHASTARGMSARDAWVNGFVAEVHRVLARYAVRDDREQ